LELIGCVKGKKNQNAKKQKIGEQARYSQGFFCQARYSQGF
jgi:hypothetical protein